MHIADVVEAIDDVDTDHDEPSNTTPHSERSERSKTYGRNGEERGDESDYYTPEEPAPSHPGPMYEENGQASSVESTPQRLPGTPLSHASARSSGDSYTSGSSTRHLLAVANVNLNSDRSVHV